MSPTRILPYLPLIARAAALLLVVGCVSLPAAAEPDFVVSPWPDKLLYDPGETATFTVAVTNNTTGLFAGKLAARVIWEMEDTKPLGERPIVLAGGEVKSVTFQWNDLPEVLGCEVRADLLDNDGNLVATGAEYFNVCRAKDTCRVGIHAVGLGLITTSDPEFLKTIPKVILNDRRGYVNIGEYFWSGSSVLDLAPQADELPGGAYWNSKTAIRMAVAEGHKYGIKAVVYTTSYSTHGLADIDIPMQHPEWLAYDDRGQPTAAVNVRQEDKLRHPEWRKHINQGGFVSANFDWTNQKLLDFHLDSLIANKRESGMDGVRYDGHPGSIWGAFNVFGQPLPTGEARLRETLRIVEYIRKRVTAVYPDYLWMFNAGTAVGGNNPIDLENGVLAPELKPVVENGGAMCDEEVRGAYSAYNRFHAWKDYADLLVSDVDLCRAHGGYAYLLFPWCSTIHRNSDEIGYSLMLAAGNHPWFSAPMDTYQTNPGGCHYPIQHELFAFATRYSALLWGHGISPVRRPEGLVEVFSDRGQIWWRNFVHQRTLKDGRNYLTVHLLNAPPNKTMGVTEQPLPEPIDNVRIVFRVPVKKVWLATARPGPPRTLPIPEHLQAYYSPKEYETMGPMKCERVEPAEGQVVLPQLRMWTMVVAELG